MAQGKTTSKKSQRITLVVTIVIIVIALLFFLRLYIGEKFGIFASSDNPTYSIVNITNKRINTYQNTEATADDKIKLKNPAQYGYVAGWASIYPNYQQTMFRSQIAVENNCKQTLKVRFCGPTMETDCQGEWYDAPLVKTNIFYLVPATYTWFGITIYPCSQGSQNNLATATAITTATSSVQAGVDIAEPPVPPPPPPPVPSKPATKTIVSTASPTATASKTTTPAAIYAVATPTPTIITVQNIPAGEFIVSGIQSGISFILTIIIVVLVGSVIVFRIITAKD